MCIFLNTFTLDNALWSTSCIAALYFVEASKFRSIVNAVYAITHKANTYDEYLQLLDPITVFPFGVDYQAPNASRD